MQNRSLKLVNLTLFSLPILIACPTQTERLNNEPITTLTHESAQKIAVYAMMSSNVYLKSDRTRFPIEKLGWRHVDKDGNPTDKNSYSGRLSNLQYDIWEHQTQPRTVIAYKGTHEVADWLTGNLSIIISPQYKKAKKEFKHYRDRHPERTIELTGHSLGGGLALSVSFWEGVNAYVFNSSPRVFDGIEDHNKPAIRKAIFQKGEILQSIRKRYPKFLEKVPASDIIETHFKFGTSNRVEKHSIDLLAEGILRCASGDETLQSIASSIEKKIECTL